MASLIWTLSRNGGAFAPLSSFGAVDATVIKASLDTGSLTFRVPADSISASAPFTYGDALVLKRAGVTHFVGRVRALRPRCNAQSSSWAITAHDSWWEMERTIYRQPIAVSKSDLSGLVGFMSSRVTLGLNSWGQPITQDAQIANAIAYADGKNPSIISLAAAPALNTFPAEETREITVAEAIRRANSLAAVGTGYFDYTTGLAALTLAERTALGLVTLDLDDADTLVDLDGPARRDDLVPPGVMFDFFTTVTDAAGQQRTVLTRQSAGSPGAAGSVHASFILGPCDTVPAGAAAAYYSALATAQWEGSLRLLEPECSGTIKPGVRLCLSNGQAAWATMNAVVQRTTEDLDQGLTTVEFGPSVVLGQDDFVDRLMRLRNRPAATAFCRVQNNGTEGTAEGVADDGSATTPDSGAGISNPATGNAPSGGAPTANSSAGVPSAAAAAAAAMGVPPGQGFSEAELTLCDGSTLKVLTR